jgi:hypothetical protein
MYYFQDEHAELIIGQSLIRTFWAKILEGRILVLFVTPNFGSTEYTALEVYTFDFVSILLFLFTIA